MIRRILTLTAAMLVSTYAWGAETNATTEDTQADSATESTLDEDLAPSFDHSTTRETQCQYYNRYSRDYAYYYCSRDANCRWDGYYCQDRFQPGPGPGPQRCEYIRDAYQCQRSGCYWDNRYGCSSYPGGGGGGREVWQCTAVDNGWEEHWGGHSAQGNTQWDAQRQALAICQKPYGPHDRCNIQSCQRVR